MTDWRALVVRSHSVVVLLLLAMFGLGLVGCDGDDGPADVDPTETGVPQSVDGMRLEVYEDDRLSFVYPREWDVEVAEGDEQQVRIQPRESGDGYPEAIILAVWPFVHSEDLDDAVDFYGRKAKEPQISDFEQRSIEVSGSNRAILQTFIATDGVPGENIPARFWTVFAMSEVGRTMGLTISVMERSQIDADAVAQVVISSLELKSPWGS